MGAISLIIIAILGITFITFGILTSLSLNKNKKLASQRMYIPFTSQINPLTGLSTGFKNIDGSASQIQCPAGQKINILGAFYNVVDPYGECVSDIADVSPQLGFLCNPQAHGPLPCTDDHTCPGWIKGSSTNPFKCDIPSGETSGFCRLNNIGTAQCSPGSNGFSFTNVNGFCIDKNICGTDIKVGGDYISYYGVPNPLCSPLNTSTMCAVRDASATVAAFCDGKTDCGDLKDVNFGDLPCTGKGMSPIQCLENDSNGGVKFASARVGYCGLPYLPGYSGGVPKYGTGSSDPGNGNIGYIMHGIYTCVDQ